MKARRRCGIVADLDHRVTSVGAENITSEQQRVEAMSQGTGSRERFPTIICLHGGGLDLAPEATRFRR